MSDKTNNDVIDFLESQHNEVERLMQEVQSTTGDDQRNAFQCLVRLLAVHETAEEEVIHPLVRYTEDGEAVVAARLKEEAEAKETLAALEKLEVGTAGFTRQFDEFAAAVKNHAEHEEREEFPRIKAAESDGARQRLRVAVEVAERLAPTHPHPHAPDGALGNLIVGPFVAIADRTRDAFHAAQQS